MHRAAAREDLGHDAIQIVGTGAVVDDRDSDRERTGAAWVFAITTAIHFASDVPVIRTIVATFPSRSWERHA
jgi:hypothetical protein